MSSVLASVWMDKLRTTAIERYSIARKVKGPEERLLRARMQLFADICLAPNADASLSVSQQVFVTNCIEHFALELSQRSDEKKPEALAKRATYALMLATYIVRCNG